jgi:anti-sigma regulatory factor (Ser/Thr protein kinase)
MEPDRETPPMQAFRDIAPPRRAWTVRADIQADSHAPYEARRALAPLLDDLDQEAATAVKLVVSELVTNSVRHAAADEGALIELEATADRDRIRLTVRDHGHGFDPSGSSDPGVAGGWGLQVVDRLVDRWWIEVDGGTRVTCELTA